jgi:hypothetical protein
MPNLFSFLFWRHKSNSSHLQLRIPEVKWWDTVGTMGTSYVLKLTATSSALQSWKLQHTLSLLCVQCRHLRHVITCRAKAMATRWKVSIAHKILTFSASIFLLLAATVSTEGYWLNGLQRQHQLFYWCIQSSLIAIDSEFGDKSSMDTEPRVGLIAYIPTGRYVRHYRALGAKV